MAEAKKRRASTGTEPVPLKSNKGKCPSCGRCQECGHVPQQPQIVPMPYPVNPWPQPYRPWVAPQPYINPFQPQIRPTWNVTGANQSAGCGTYQSYNANAQGSIIQ